VGGQRVGGGELVIGKGTASPVSWYWKAERGVNKVAEGRAVETGAFRTSREEGGKEGGRPSAERGTKSTMLYKTRGGKGFEGVPNDKNRFNEAHEKKLG